METEYHPQDDSDNDEELRQQVFANDYESWERKTENDDDVEIWFEELGVFGMKTEGVDVEGQNFEDGLATDLSVGEEIDLVEKNTTD